MNEAKLIECFLSLHRLNPATYGVAESEADYPGYRRVLTTLMRLADEIRNASEVQFRNFPVGVDLNSFPWIGASLEYERGGKLFAVCPACTIPRYARLEADATITCGFNIDRRFSVAHNGAD